MPGHATLTWVMRTRVEDPAGNPTAGSRRSLPRQCQDRCWVFRSVWAGRSRPGAGPADLAHSQSPSGKAVLQHVNEEGGVVTGEVAGALVDEGDLRDRGVTAVEPGHGNLSPPELLGRLVRVVADEDLVRTPRERATVTTIRRY